MGCAYNKWPFLGLEVYREHAEGQSLGQPCAFLSIFLYNNWTGSRSPKRDAAPRSPRGSISVHAVWGPALSLRDFIIICKFRRLDRNYLHSCLQMRWKVSLCPRTQAERLAQLHMLRQRLHTASSSFQDTIIIYHVLTSLSGYVKTWPTKNRNTICTFHDLMWPRFCLKKKIIVIVIIINCMLSKAAPGAELSRKTPSVDLSEGPTGKAGGQPAEGTSQRHRCWSGGSSTRAPPQRGDSSFCLLMLNKPQKTGMPALASS